ncbi:hypothetical protein [Methylobacterium frigidaeris]|uniref:Uncharacterized protein n=1 Tax=Methylobacterium frigidaeris TaxID=2038277 RepID=A0AA37HEZ2_9HYPH|nr:hypothetical protein [Methylobacterium frigidaeris]GJD64653.1 hypothetical protein MPEAHAMD_4838 [Methylobacterium frigidaeris]
MRYYEIVTVETATKTAIIKPEGPLTPVQACRKADRRAGIEKRIRDQQAASARKVADLRAKLSG